MEALGILERIAIKGGVVGACAKKHADEIKKAEAFIRECYHQCHNNSAVKFWGEELIKDIREYVDNINNT